MLSAPPVPLLAALDTVTLATPQPAALAELFTRGLGWVTVAEGAIDAALETLWSIEAGGAGDRFLLLRAPQARHGSVRLVGGRPRARSRAVAARWAGLEFSAGDGRAAPPGAAAALAGFSALAGFEPGAVAGAPAGPIAVLRLVTPRFERSQRFYAQTLGLAPAPLAAPVSAPWSAGWRLPAAMPVELELLAGTATDGGALALTGVPERIVDPERASWTDFDGGACLATFTSSAFERAYEAIERARDTLVLARPRSVRAPPYDGRRAFVCLGPDGERLEILES